MVCFLLSGFVIFASENERVRELRGFYPRRLRRIHPIVLIAMGVPAAVWGLGLSRHTPTWRSALATLFSVDDLGSKPGASWAGPFSTTRRSGPSPTRSSSTRSSRS
jgi:peptidoglycan/LPS O-acetylase OafA/YrhL